MNEKIIHTGRNARKAGLLQDSILPYVCATVSGMLGRVKDKRFIHKFVVT